MVLLVGGNSGQRVSGIKPSTLFYHELPARAVYNLLQLLTKAPTTMTIQHLWQRVKKSKWYRNFRISLLLERWSTLSPEQMKTELRKQQLNRMLSKPKHDKN